MVLEKLKQVFGMSSTQAASENESVPDAPLASRVFRGRSDITTPDIAADVSPAKLTKACGDNLVCKFVCHINRHRIYGESSRDSQDVSAIFQGITANCDAIQRYGEVVASEEGYRGAYKYVDLNHIFECCCGTPDKCRFYNKAIGEKHGFA